MDDMTYSFLWDTEPSDAQLERLMQEVVEDARIRRIKADEDFKKLIHKEVKLATERNKSLLKELLGAEHET
ncbi:hypothetical protein EZS27_038951 [termite gut metagenome]|uniref:Uncharacterized protein n=1 Tax=termite gut metagenome TaxID=433724 RepID=A0A5J4PJC5_9ZZZZ